MRAAALFGACALAAFLLTSGAQAQDTAMPVPRSLPPVPPKAAATSSPVFDKEAALILRQRQDPTYVERIYVEGRDPDAPRGPRKPVEQRFADTLLAPPSASAVGLRMLDTTPCMSLASTWNNIGSSFVPPSGCPR